MILTQFRPDIELTIYKDNKGWLFNSKASQAFSIFDAVSHKLVSYSTPNNAGLALPIKHALDFEKSLSPQNKPFFPQPLSPTDRHDLDRSSHTTGGGRRNFISLSLERALNNDEAIKTDGLLALLSWARDQGQRPVCWQPFQFNYDAYYGVIGEYHSNPTWKYDKQDKDGWSIFDPAHLESAHLFSGAALGLDECLHHFTCLFSWVISTFPGKSSKSSTPLKGWHGSKQPRAAGWMIWYLTRAVLLGFDTADQEFIDKFLAGHRPKEHLVAYLNDLITMDFPIGAEVADDRTMVNIGMVNGISQLRGALSFQECILRAGLGYLLRTNIINDPLRTKVSDWLNDRTSKVLTAAVDSRGMAYSFTRDKDFNQSHVDLANSLEKDPGHRYELVQINGQIRDTPRVADCELMVGAAALHNGPTDQTAIMLNNLLPRPDNPNYQKIARYADPFYGLQS